MELFSVNIVGFQLTNNIPLISMIQWFDYIICYAIVLSIQDIKCECVWVSFVVFIFIFLAKMSAMYPIHLQVFYEVDLTLHLTL